MSFQGDVGGIGLAELLQSLARSRREGVLRLSSREGLRCTLGVQSGLVHLLPEPDEDGAYWRARAQQAWALEHDDRLDGVRTSEVARAARIELIYRLLDSDEVHFRFENEPIPDPNTAGESQEDPHAPVTARSVNGPRRVQIGCETIPVELLLLEFARLSDELTEFPEGLPFDDGDVPLRVREGACPHVPEEFLAEIDGASSLREIAERLAWPLRQARLALAHAVRGGVLATTDADALLELVFDELAEGRLGRAADRAGGWIRRSPPGAMSRHNAQVLETEWREGRLVQLMNELTNPQIRAILRRLDHSLGDLEQQVRRWREMQSLRRSDAVFEMHLIASRARLGAERQASGKAPARGRDDDDADEESLELDEDELSFDEDGELRVEVLDDELQGADGQQDDGEGEQDGVTMRWGRRRRRVQHDDTPSAHELLDYARRLRELGHPWRALPLLRMAAHRQPSGAQARIELGAGLVDGGAVSEGAPWILETARDLIDGGTPEKAVDALRALLDVAPGMNEARRLASRARSMIVRRQIIRKHSVVAIAVLAVLSVVGWVQIHLERSMESRLEEVSSLLTDPIEAMERFERYFDGDENERVAALGAAIRMKRRDDESRLRTDWNDRYRAALNECALGDPVVGLERALTIKAPPVLVTINEPWPLVEDLFNGLGARLDKELEDLGPVELDAPEQVAAEKLLAERVDALAAKLEEAPERQVSEDLRTALEALGDAIAARTVEREDARERRDRLDLVKRQELLLSAARTHKEAGDLERALVVYERLLETDSVGSLARILDGETRDLRTRVEAHRGARELAEAGRHEEAVARLGELDRVERFSLPWKLETFPSGAMAELPDGSRRPTPFTLESAVDDRFEVRLTLAGHLPQRVLIEGPRDRFVWLPRETERTWRTDGRVDALPQPTGKDHIVCDRSGHIARLGNGARTLWERNVATLGGIARSPVFLAQRPGCLLVLTEDGEAWIVAAKTGDLEGPYDLGSPPAGDPWLTPEGAAVRLRDGRLFEWRERLEPRPLDRDDARVARFEPTVSDGYSETGALAVLRAPSGSRRTLDSPWTDWSVEIADEVYRVRHGGDDASGFAAHRNGNWSFLAWEAPNASLPFGRLWISDDDGLRAYVP